MKLKNKKSRNIIGIIQSCLIFALVILVIFMMIQIDRLQGTARVINYAGLVRGATQREVKLEITGSQNDELIKYLDDILSGLKYQDGNYDLVKLHDKEYQDKLLEQRAYTDARTGLPNRSACKEILKCLCLEKDKLNNTGNELPIDYACGWAISEDYKESTIQMLFDRADSYMYENKQICKKQNQ